jgi:hypothetical protein
MNRLSNSSIWRESSDFRRLERLSGAQNSSQVLENAEEHERKQ